MARIVEWRALIVISLIAGPAVAGWVSLGGAHEEFASVNVQAGNISRRASLTGVLLPARRVAVTTSVAGTVRVMNVVLPATLTIACGFIAAIWPAEYAARLDPVVALSRE